MKHDCDIVRDLMPLCIDNTASENSRKLVGEHVLECQPCMKMYQEMRTEVPKEPPVSKEAQPFSRTVRKLRKRQRIRRIIIGVAGALLGMLLCLMGSSIFSELTNDYAVIAEDEDYHFNLYRRTNGQIVVMHKNISGKCQDARWTYDATTGILKFFSVTPTWALKTERVNTPYLYNELYWDEPNGRLMIRWPDANGIIQDQEVKEVHKGAQFKGNGYLPEILYVQGNDLPMVDPGMDAGYAVPEYGQNGVVYYDVVEYAFYPPYVTAAPTPAVETVLDEDAAAEAAAAEIAYIQAMENATSTPQVTITPQPTSTPQATATPIPMLTAQP